MLPRATSVGALLLAAHLIAAPALAGPMTAGERQRLVAHLEMTEAWLVSELDGLSDAQLAFKVTPESWSIAQVAEHLAIAEPQMWAKIEASLKAPVTAGLKPQVTDEAVLWYGIDRTNREKTPEAQVPHATFPGARESLASFRKLRATMLTMAKTSQEDFRGRPHTGSPLDLYQGLLMASAHSQRHILQIREIKAHPGYPKK